MRYDSKEARSKVLNGNCHYCDYLICKRKRGTKFNTLCFFSRKEIKSVAAKKRYRSIMKSKLRRETIWEM